MKVAPRFLPFLLAVTAIATSFYAQQQTGTVTGIVLDKDGKTPLAGATVQIDSLVKLVMAAWVYESAYSPRHYAMVVTGILKCRRGASESRLLLTISP
jgi:hypothetical protein